MATAQPTQTNPAATPVVVGTVVDARLNFLRMSPRKVRLVAAAVVGMDAPAAVDYLKLVNKLPSRPLAKLIASAIANGQHNFGARADNLFVKRILVNQGPTLKRWQPKAYGRAGKIRKRSAHITVELAERKPSGKMAKASGPAAGGAKPVTAAVEPPKPSTTRPPNPPVPTSGKRGGGRGFTRTLFNRKSG